MGIHLLVLHNILILKLPPDDMVLTQFSNNIWSKGYAYPWTVLLFDLVSITAPCSTPYLMLPIT